ncbi:MAG: Ig-like domain-containing protein [Methanobrevibacter sp.]|nr:Ig-like domain-containing protein [Methanobrevibacter sp.]
MDVIDLGNRTVLVNVKDNATGNVTIIIDNTTYVVNVTGGENTIPIPGVSEGTHNINVTYNGDGKYKPVSYATNVTVFKSIVAGPIKRGWNSPYDYKAEFLNKDGTTLVNANVQFIINGKTYNVKTDGEGIGYVTDSHLPVGVYHVTVINPVTGEQVTSTITIVKCLLENKDITMDFVDGTYYVVRAICDDGEPVGAGEFVDIYANTIHYSCRTDKDGYARLLINLNPKKYVLRAEYKNTEVVNNLVVKQTLKLVKKTVKVKKGKKLKLKAKLKGPTANRSRVKRLYSNSKAKNTKQKPIPKVLQKLQSKRK